MTGPVKNGAAFVLAALLMLGSAAAADDAIPKKNEFDFEHVSCKGAPNEIRIVVEGVKKSIGLMTADLYVNDQDGFLHRRGRVKQVKFAAKAPETKFCLTAPKSGEYAIAVYHDRNANGDFDKTGLGLPAEPWGISNNPKVRFGPPPVEKALFAVTEHGTEVEINLN